MNRSRTRNRLELLGALLCAAALAAGCSNSASPDVDDYADRTTPQGVLDRITESYDARDASTFLTCLAEDFAFYLEPNTVIADPTLPDYWGRGTEQMIHEEAFSGRATATSVTLTLNQERDPLEIQGPNPGDPSAWEYYQQYTVRAVIDGITHQVNGFASFKLETHEGDTSAQGEPLWSVSEWSDTGDVPCRDEADSQASAASFDGGGTARASGLSRRGNAAPSGGAAGRTNATNWTEMKLLFGDNAAGYPLRTTVENVMAKFEASYEALDPVALTDCLAESFTFWLSEDDVMSDPSLPWSWDVETESTIAWNMFGDDTNIESVQLTLTQIGAPVPIPLPGGGSDWQVDYNADLWIHLPGNFTFWANAVERFVISFDEDDTGPDGEQLWEIVSWAESSYVRGEESSWGSIKAMYR